MSGAEALGILNTTLKILGLVSGWPLGLTLALIFLGPWIAMLFIARSQEKQAAKHDLETVKLVDSIKDGVAASVSVYEGRHKEAVQMYRDNAELVKSYSRLAEDQSAIIHLNTQAMTRLVDKIEAMYPRGGN